VRLTINDENVTYSLEKEKTLGEVVHGVRAWLGAAGFVITGLSADGSDLLESPAESWGKTAVAGITALSVRTTHSGDIRIAHWKTVETWLRMLRGELGALPKGSSAETLEELLKDLQETAKGLASNPFLPPGSDAVGRLLSLFADFSAAAVRSWSAERIREACELVDHLRGSVESRLADALHPEAALARCSQNIRASMEELKEVSVLLQTGRDRPAMEAVIRFADLAQAIMELLPFLPPDPERGRLFAELTPVLKELVGAFDSRDSVLIGDLLEYEVAPRLEKLAPLLGRPA
jgi:hypothetical protein